LKQIPWIEKSRKYTPDHFKNCRYKKIPKKKKGRQILKEVGVHQVPDPVSRWAEENNQQFILLNEI
jgi:hypothetical protein